MSNDKKTPIEPVASDGRSFIDQEADRMNSVAISSLYVSLGDMLAQATKLFRGNIAERQVAGGIEHVCDSTNVAPSAVIPNEIGPVSKEHTV